MSYRDIDLAKIRVNEVLKTGLESQRVYRELSESNNANRKDNLALLRNMILAAACNIREYGEKLYCRSLGLIHSRPACP